MTIKTGSCRYIRCTNSISTKSVLNVIGKVVVLLATLVSYAGAQDLPTITAYRPVITETVDENGFLHPGIGVTKEVLENIRNQIEAKQEPWYSYYTEMLESFAASRTVTSSNRSSVDPTLPRDVAFNSQGFDSRFIADGLKAYTQALLYYITGDEVYRANAMAIIRIWEQMDPDQYEYFVDSHIHTGIPMNRMMTAAEILRYTSSQNEELKWTEEDTVKLTNNLITPVIETFQHTNNEFMNQHNYPLMGAMAGYIFTSNVERYAEAVEWMTVNKTAVNQGFNGSIKRLFRLVDTDASTGEVLDTPVVQHVEMGRDQAHGGGDLNNATIIARMFLAQGTKVDPVDGTLSTDEDAVGIYEFLDDRILAAADYFWGYMLGYPTDWVPTPFSIFSDGTVRGIYHRLSGAYRGRLLTTNFWGLYYYYTYARGVDLEQKAPNYYEAFLKRVPSNFYWGGGYAQTWNSPDGGADFWLYIPEEAAAAEGDKYLPKEQVSDSIIEAEERYTQLDTNSSIGQEGDTSYLELVSSPEGTNVSFFNFAYSGDALVGIKLRTYGEATISISASVESAPYRVLHVPDTNGQWVYITYEAPSRSSYSLVNLTAEGNGTTVDIDHFNIKGSLSLTPPVFNSGNEATKIVSFVGASVSSSFTATDSDANDTITYSAANLPGGSALDPETGLFSWDSAQAGDYSFVVIASDGETTSTKLAKITVAGDRVSAFSVASAQYDPELIYTIDTLEAFESVYDTAASMIETASDDEFSLQLAALNNATEALELVTPRLADGSINYPNLVDSSFGGGISALVDGDNDTFTGFLRGSNLFHIMDFGTDYKVSATAFGIQSRMNFNDRGAGVTVYASNDTLTWTRITPGESEFKDAMSILEVDSAYLGEAFRYFMFEMIDPQPDALRNQVLNLMELSEIRIFGQRFESDNKLEEVALSSPDADETNLVTTGSTVTVSIVAEEVVSNMVVKIQGVEAEVTSTDGIHWTATAIIDEVSQFGNAIVSVQYDVTNENGTSTIEASYVTDIYLTDGSDIISDVADKVFEFIDPSTSYGRPSETVTAANVGYLFDGNRYTTSDFRLGGNGSGGYIAFDFGEGNGIALTGVDMLARQDGYYYRINGAVAQGSNDGETWTTLSSDAFGTKEWQFLSVDKVEKYRFIRLYNSSNWFGNMAEVRFHGTYYGPVDAIETVSMHSDDADGSGVIETGESVTLNLGAVEEIENLKVSIQGVDAVVSSTDNINWTATATMQNDVALGYVQFSVDYNTVAGTKGRTETATSDGTKLYLIDGSDLIRNVTSIVDLIDPSTTHGRPDADVTLKMANYLFDANIYSVSDFRSGSSGWGSYITFDFKEGNSIVLKAVDLLARQDRYYDRTGGAVVQGSNDNENWDTISDPAGYTRDWQTLAINSTQAYRYIRMYNHKNWWGNMAELRLHADTTPPVTIDDAPEGWVSADATVTLTATDDYSGVTDTYFIVNTGEIQTGTSITVSEEGVTKIRYWSEDVAGNVEAPNETTVMIDKTAPVLEFTVDGETISSGDKIEDYQSIEISVMDELSGLAGVSLTIDGQEYPVDVDGSLSQTVNFSGLLGEHNISISALDLAGNALNQSYTVVVETSINSLLKLIEKFVGDGKIQGSLEEEISTTVDYLLRVCGVDESSSSMDLINEDDLGFDEARRVLNGLSKLSRLLAENSGPDLIDPEAKAVLEADLAALIVIYDEKVDNLRPSAK